MFIQKDTLQFDLNSCLFLAGDHVKFGFPLAWTITTLAWGVIEFKEAYVAAREFTNMLNLLKWVTDYFIKAHTSKYEFYGQVSYMYGSYVTAALTLQGFETIFQT